MLLWEERPRGHELEPGIYQYEVHQYDYNMSLTVVIKDPVLPIRAALIGDGEFYYLSIVDGNDRNQAQFCRRV